MHLIAQCFLLLLLTVVGAVRVTQKAVGTVLVNNLQSFDFTLYRHTSIKFRTTCDSRDWFAITTLLPRCWITYTIWALKGSNCKREKNKVKIIKPKKSRPSRPTWIQSFQLNSTKSSWRKYFVPPFFLKIESGFHVCRAYEVDFTQLISLWRFCYIMGSWLDLKAPTFWSHLRLASPPNLALAKSTSQYSLVWYMLQWYVLSTDQPLKKIKKF